MTETLREPAPLTSGEPRRLLRPAPGLSAFIVLPFPPSVNGLYAGKARRYKSAAYKLWIHSAGLTLNKQNIFPYFTGPVRETIRLGRPDKRIRDCFNYEKAINDLLVEWLVLEDDSWIHDGQILWDDEVVGATVFIEEIL